MDSVTGIAALRPTDAGIPTKGTRSFGFDRGDGHTHQGIDMRAPRHGPARAVSDGVVEHASNSLARGFSGYGRHVVIKKGKKGPWFLYAHLEHASVSRGDTVKLGQTIGTVGDSCFSKADPSKACKGVHLHFEVSPTSYGTMANPGQDSEAPRLDPVAYLTRDAISTEDGYKVVVWPGYLADDRPNTKKEGQRLDSTWATLKAAEQRRTEILDVLSEGTGPLQDHRATVLKKKKTLPARMLGSGLAIWLLLPVVLGFGFFLARGKQ